VLGSPESVALDATKARLRESITDQWQPTTRVRDALGAERPSDEQIRLALNAMAKDREIERDPPLGANETRGRVHQWRLR
jgi:hypothetical protein